MDELFEHLSCVLNDSTPTKEEAQWIIATLRAAYDLGPAVWDVRITALFKNPPKSPKLD